MKTWIKFNERIVELSSISAMRYNAAKFELRVYEHSGYTNVVEAEPDDVAKLKVELDITPNNLVLVLGEDTNGL